jgi:ParB family chromosome partitioning protein
MSPSAAAVVDTTEAVPQFVLLGLGDISPSPLNPRKHFDLVKLRELAATMGNGVGIIEPLVVRPTAAKKAPAPYELVAGERRWRAAAIAGLASVPAIVKHLTDPQVLEVMVIENDQREDINPLEEGDGFKRLMTFGFDIDKLAGRIGRSRKYIYDRVKLLDLIDPARELLLSERITAGHAILIARLTAEQQRKVIGVAKRNGYGSIEGPLFEHDALLDDPESETPKGDVYHGLKPVSVRELEAWIAQHCRFDLSAPVSQELFPVTVAAVEEAKKVIHITYNHMVNPDAKDGESQRVYSVVSWRRADGTQKSKTCAKSVTGVFVVGPHRGEALEVCVHKECPTHWGAEKRAKAKASKSTAAQAAYQKREAARQEGYRREREARERKELAWKTARPETLKAIAAKVRSMPIGKVISELVGATRDDDTKEAMALLDLKPAVPEEALRILLMSDLVNDSDFWGIERLTKRAKSLLGVDVAGILRKVQTAAEAKTPAKASAKPAKKTAAKKR